jgi:hypothetical protein
MAFVDSVPTNETNDGYNMQTQPAVIFLLLGLFSGQAFADPSLSETLSWMDNTYNDHSAVGGTIGHGYLYAYKKGVLQKRDIESFTYKGCEIAIRSKEDPSSPMYKDMHAESEDHFNLKDIDSGSIIMTKLSSKDYALECIPGAGACDEGIMSFDTRDTLPLIDTVLRVASPDQQGSKQSNPVVFKTDSSSFLFDDLQYAERFEKAFKHAVKLCGGKKSPF